MGLFGFILLCVAAGFLTWLAIRFVPMPDAVKTFLPIAVIAVLVLILLAAMGIFQLDTPIPRMR